VNPDIRDTPDTRPLADALPIFFGSSACPKADVVDGKGQDRDGAAVVCKCITKQIRVGRTRRSV